MSCIRPATPGFILTTIATGLLAVVSFCVPYFKSVFFLKANITSNGISGTITFGTLGYCVELSGTTTCSKPSVGYELDINSLVGNNFPIQIPDVVVKWLTYVLVLHIVALALSAGGAVFGLLAHIREMSMVYCSTCVSGFAAAVALIAFIFDLALFFVARSRINAVGSASIGNAIWLTLAAWIILFFSGCFYTLGRCCLSNRKRGDWQNRKNSPEQGFGGGGYGGTEQLRLDAVKAEAERKARQKAHEEAGLPAFAERQPLTTTAYDDGSGNIYTDKLQLPQSPSPTGYVQATPGSRAVDQYYDNASGHNTGGYNAAAAVYPPALHRNRTPSTPSAYNYNAPPQRQAQNTYPAQQYQSTPPPLPSQQPYRSTPPPQQAPLPQQYQQPNSYHDPAASNANPYLDPAASVQPYLDPSASNPYLGHAGHPSRGTSYHSAATHQGEYSQYDPYDGGAHATSEYYPAQAAYGQTAYGQTSQYGTPQGQSQPQSMYTAQTQTPHSPLPEQHSPHEDPYGGYSDGYGANSVPPLDTTAGYFPEPAHSQAGSSSNAAPTSPTSPKGPRAHRQSLGLHTMNAVEEDSPPEYDNGASEYVPGAWGKKG